MPWTYLQVEISREDLLAHTLVGPYELTREQAHTEVQAIIDRAAAVDPALGKLSAIWRRGAKDDTVFAGLVTFALVEHEGDDGRAAVREWLTDWAETFRTAGLDVQVARW